MSEYAPPMFAARVKAVLGPTNTGKTHLAITRLLAHSSGIIGFPLRLLARENYDRMVAVKGERFVALITGEEKIIPPEAKWFACTVEAMPLANGVNGRRAEFVAVDEIQLCADPDRGHVFTDRLLHARGLVETMFLGAETIRPLLQRLVPQAEIDTRPRLSQLSHAGPSKLVRLPPRSAVVAFSAGEVYAIAEAIRRRRGGCAVVMGRLSPRTRNAQVALYQNREVDFLVATDAIGMGLNMDVDHVAFASLNKFDGHAGRGLTAQEAAQIAGRAGRGMRDGTFGTTGDCPPLPDEMVEQIEGHHFEPLQTLAWRNSALDFSSVDGLLDSLGTAPGLPGLAKGHDATDHIVLSMLAREPEMRALAGSRARVATLWEACQVPDFRKLSDDTHTRLCGRIFKHLAEDGVLPEDWVAEQIAHCANIEGDLDTLMARLANIRVWSYVAARADWMKDAASFQIEARKAEDAVSDALHERLTARFVDRRAAHLMRRLDDTEEELLSAVTRRGEVIVEGHQVGRVAGFVFQPEDGDGGEEERKLVMRAARRALREEMPRRVAALEVAKDEAFSLTPLHGILWDESEVARLRPGPEPSKPQVEVIASEFLDGPQRERVRARLAKWIEAVIARELGFLTNVEAKAEADNTLRGPAFRLRETLGIAPGNTDGSVSQELRQKLKGIGVRAGRYALFVPEALKPRAMALRAQLWALVGEQATPALANAGLVALHRKDVPEGEPVPPPMSWPPGFAEQMGWLDVGPALLRLDVVERIAGELAYLTRRAPAPPPPDLASRLGVKADQLGVVLAAMGFRLLEPEPLAEDAYGPPTPLRVAAPRPARHGPPQHRGGPQRDRHGDRHGERNAAPGGPSRHRQPRPERLADAMAAPTGAPTGTPADPAASPAQASGEAPAEQRGPRRENGARDQGRPWQGRPPRQGSPGQTGSGHGGPGHGGPGQGDTARSEGHGAGRGPRDRPPRQGGPHGGPERREAPRERPPAQPNPDSPFAILAKLKLQ